MDVILVPGFWLGADSWSEVTPVIEAAGHVPHPLTLPGLERDAADRSAIHLRDQVDAVVAEIDRASGPVALVGHSGGGPIAYGAADARVDRVARIVYVDTFPVAEGIAINERFTVENGEIALPEWDAFDAEDVEGLDERNRSRLRDLAVPEPAHVSLEVQELHDDRRRDIPSVVIASSRTPASYDEWRDHPYLAELLSQRALSWTELPGASHWPQLTRPAELGAAIVAALAGE